MIKHFNGKLTRGGFIKAIVIIVVALIVLGYFGYNLQDIVKSPTVQGNLNYAWGLVRAVWNNYLAVPFDFIWNRIIIGIGWHNVQKIIETYQQ
jgi:hypothetical protein